MLLIDCGNSTLKAQWRDSERLRASFQIRYAGNRTGRLRSWLRGVDAERCWLASVLDAERQALLDGCLAESFGDAVVRLKSEACAAGVINAYPQAHRLGVDRWLALIGARQLASGADCIVIDAGSAITLDLLRADGRHLGGAILPGVNTSRERFRQIFRHIDFDDPRIAENAGPGCSTEAAIQIDYAHDPLDRLRDLVTRWKKDLAPETRILLAGGDAARVQAALAEGRIVPDLVFVGMARLAR